MLLAGVLGQLVYYIQGGVYTVVGFGLHDLGSVGACGADTCPIGIWQTVEHVKQSHRNPRYQYNSPVYIQS